jgi:hypothetical protein
MNNLWGLSSRTLFLFAWLLLAAPIVCPGDALDNWSQAKIITNGLSSFGSLYGVTYGNGQFVAVGGTGDPGFLQTSQDGVNWVMPFSNSLSVLELYDIVYYSGMFVAVGYDGYYGTNIYHSTNGINWVPHASGIANVFRVTRGGSVFVAVGDGAIPFTSNSYTNRNIFTSADGITWTARSSGTPPNDVHFINDVAYGAGRFVAVATGNILTSATGTTWTKTNYPNAGNQISFCNNIFILTSGPGSNLLSSDGLNWTLVTNNTAASFKRVVYVAGTYFALTDSTAFSSSDGTNWVHRNLQTPGNVGFRALAVGPSNIVAVGLSSSSGWVPVGYVSGPFVGATMGAGYPPHVLLSGLLGRTYRIDYLTNLRSNNWQAAATFTLTNSPTNWTDIQATNSSRFYRAVLLP